MTNLDSPRCAFINVWFGPFPVWMNFFLESCGRNARTFDWFIFTDQPAPRNAPSNVFCRPMDMAMFNKRVHDRLPYDVTITSPYKICDMKVFYGLLFSEYLEPYDYWGHCDIDMVWGDLETLLKPELQKDYDIVTADAIRTSGFCTIYRNVRRINRLCTKIPDVEQALQQPGYAFVDEWRLPQLLATQPDVRVSYALRHVEQPDERVIIWENGRLFADDEEHVLFHMHKWFDVKKDMIVDSVKATDARWLIKKGGFFSANDVQVASSDLPRASEGILIKASAQEGDDALSLIRSIRTWDNRPILVIDCGLQAQQIAALSACADVMHVPIHAYSPDNASQPHLIERSPFDRTLWLAPHCFVLQSLNEAFIMMREHPVIGMHHDALLGSRLDEIRGPNAFPSFPKVTTYVYEPMFHLSTDVIGYRAGEDQTLMDAWKAGLQYCNSDSGVRDALLWAMMQHCPHHIWTIAPCQVWNAAPLAKEETDPTFTANKQRGDRIVNRSWAVQREAAKYFDLLRMVRALIRRSDQKAYARP